MAACGNTRPPSKGCCHLSQRWSPWSLHHPSPAHRRGGVRTTCCSILTDRGVQALPTGAHKPEGLMPKLEAHLMLPFALPFPELMPSCWTPCSRCCGSARHPGGGCSASISTQGRLGLRGAWGPHCLLSPRYSFGSSGWGPLVYLLPQLGTRGDIALHQPDITEILLP